MDNPDNDELLERLRPGGKTAPQQTPTPPTSSASSVDNDALLAGLQPGKTSNSAAASYGSWTATSGPSGSVRSPRPAVSMGVNQVGKPKCSVFLLIGSAALVGVIALVTGVALFANSNAGTDVGSDSASDVAPDVPPADSSLFTPPIDVPAIIESVRSRTVMFECSPVGADYVDYGSGFLLDASPLTGDSGTVFVTNEHVISDCVKSGFIEAIYGGQTYPARIVASDKKWDLAIMEIPSLTSMSPLRMASETAAAGQWVMAVGSPLGVQDSVSFGYITNMIEDEYFLTSDAVLGPGNSGGPLTNNKGEVLGVNTAVWEEATGISLTRPLDALCVKFLPCK